MGIGGDGIAVTAALQADMGAVGLSMDTDEKQLIEVLGVAGKSLAGKIPECFKGNGDDSYRGLSFSEEPASPGWCTGCHGEETSHNGWINQ